MTHARLAHTGYRWPPRAYQAMLLNPATPKAWKLTQAKSYHEVPYGEDTPAELSDWFEDTRIKHIPDEEDIWGNLRRYWNPFTRRFVPAGDCDDAVVHRIEHSPYPLGSLSYLVCRTRERTGHLVLLVHTTEGDVILDNRYNGWWWLEGWLKKGNAPICCSLAGKFLWATGLKAT